MEKEEIINLIKGRIEVECRKHAKLDWSRIAAAKIYTEWFEYFNNENQELQAKILELKKDVEYWQGEYDHWHQQAMEMARKKYTEEDIINIVKKSRETGLTAEYLILQLNKQD